MQHNHPQMEASFMNMQLLLVGIVLCSEKAELTEAHISFIFYVKKSLAKIFSVGI